MAQFCLFCAIPIYPASYNFARLQDKASQNLRLLMVCGGGCCLSRFDGFVLSACPPEHHGFSPLILRNSLRIHHKSGNGPQVGISQQGGSRVPFPEFWCRVHRKADSPRSPSHIRFEACVLSALNRLISVRVHRRDCITHRQQSQHPAIRLRLSQGRS